MSALPRERTNSRRSRYIRLVPKPALSRCSKTHAYSITSSARNKSDVAIDRPRACAVRIEHRFEFRWPLDRQFSRIGATQDFASHDTAQPKQAEQIWPVSQQPSGSREIRKKRHVAQPSTPRLNRDATVFQTPADS